QLNIIASRWRREIRHRSCAGLRTSAVDPLLSVTTVFYREIQSKRCQRWDSVAQSRAKISLPMRKAAWPQGHAAADRPAYGRRFQPLPLDNLRANGQFKSRTWLQYLGQLYAFLPLWPDPHHTGVTL